MWFCLPFLLRRPSKLHAARNSKWRSGNLKIAQRDFKNSAAVINRLPKGGRSVGAAG